MRRWWLRVAVSVTAATVLLTFVPIAEVWRAIRGVNPLVWVASVGLFIGGHALNALKLRVLLGPGTATVASCLQAHFTGIASNLGLPGVAGGDIVRAAWLSRSTGVSVVTRAAVTDRIVDGLVLMGLVAGAAVVGDLPVGIDVTSRAGLAVAVAALLAAVVLAILARRSRSAFPSWIRAVWSGMVTRPYAVLLAVTISAGVQSAFVMTNVWLASEVGIETAVAPWFVAWAGSKLSAVLPISLGGLGVREATLVSVLAAYGAPPDGVLATGILWQGALVVGSLGGFLALQVGRK